MTTRNLKQRLEAKQWLSEDSNRSLYCGYQSGHYKDRGGAIVDALYLAGATKVFIRKVYESDEGVLSSDELMFTCPTEFAVDALLEISRFRPDELKRAWNSKGAITFSAWWD